MPSFAAVGDVMLDLELDRGAGRHDARIRVRPGGSAANACVWAAAAGASSRCIACVGDDMAALALTQALDRHGVDARLAVDPRHATGVVALVDGELAVERGASAELPVAHLDGLLEADAVLVSGYLLFHDDTAAVGAAALAQARASWLAVDGGSPGLLAAGLDRAAGAAALFLGEAAARATGAGSPEQTVLALGTRFRLVCVTLGEAGVVASLDGRTAHAEPPVVHPGRASGAGDAFAAGVLVALADGAGLTEALTSGCALGAAAAAAPDGWPSPR